MSYRMEISPADVVRLRGMGVLETDAAVDWAKKVVKLVAQKMDAEERLAAAEAAAEAARKEAAEARRQLNLVMALSAVAVPVMALILGRILGGI
jgi:hypothetical protein